MFFPRSPRSERVPLRRRPLVGLAALRLLLLLAAPGHCLRAQVAKDFSIPAETYEGAHQGQVKTLITGKQLQPGGDKRYLAKILKIETFPETGDITKPEMVIEAPDCNFNTTNFTANSSGPLEMHSTDGKLRIDGRGFQWEKRGTNSVLVISNEVHTTILRALVAANATGATTAPAAAANPGGTNQTLEIFADSFSYDRGANLITYTGHVRGADDQIELQCATLVIRRNAANAIERLDADREVVIVRKGTDGRATGTHGVYTVSGGERRLRLTGAPRYEEGATEATAEEFEYDPVRRTMLARGEAYLKLPRKGSDDGGGALFGGPAGKAADAPLPDAGAGFTRIFAATLFFELPPTNGPVQRVTADHGVVILQEPGDGRAAADHAVYTQTAGQMDLTGHAFWESAGRVLRGATLAYNDKQQTLSARTNAYFRVPTATFGGAASGPGAGPVVTNQFIEVTSERYDYTNSVLTFRGAVRAGLLADQTIRATLEAETLRVTVTPERQIRRVEALGQVHAHQPPVADATGRRVEKDLQCAELDVLVRTNSLLEEFTARGLVRATQTETRTNRAAPTLQGLTADSARAVFFPATNRVAQGTATGAVVLWKDDTTAHGRELFYTGTNDLARLTGDPIMFRPGVVSTQDRILFDHGRGDFVFGESRRTVVRVDTAKARAARTNSPSASVVKPAAPAPAKP